MHRLVEVLLILTLGLGAAAKTPSVITFKSGDDAKAGLMLAKFLKANGFKVETTPKALNKKGYIVVKYNGHVYFMTTRLSKDPTRIDRLLVYEMFQVKKEKAQTEEFKDWVLKLNNDYNIGSFSFTKDLFVITSQLTFLDRLSIEELKAFLKDFSESTAKALILSGGERYLQ